MLATSSADNIIGLVLVLHDTSELRGLARQMTYQVSHDALTGLVNRREFERRLQEAMDVVMPMWYDHGVSQCRSVFAWSRALTPAIKVPLVVRLEVAAQLEPPCSCTAVNSPFGRPCGLMP